MTTANLRTYVTAGSGAWAAAVFQFVAGVIIVRSLAPADVGIFFFGAAIAALVFGLLDLRIEEALTQLLVRDIERGVAARSRAALRYAVGVDIVTGAAILLATAAAVWGIAWDVGSETRLVVAVTALASFVGAADGSFAAVLYAQHAFGWISAYQIVANGGRCAALLVLPIETPGDAAWAMVVAQLAATLFIGFAGLRRLPQERSPVRLLKRERRALLRFSTHVAVASAVATVRATAIPLVVGTVGTTREVASARVAEAPTRLLGIAAAPLRTVLFPRLSRAWARRDRAAATRLVRQYVVSTALLACALGTAMALAMDQLLTRIYGGAYSGLAHVGQLFVLAAALDATAGWQKVAPAALDRPWLRSLILGAEAVVVLAALVVLVPSRGAAGAAVSAAVAAGVSIVVGVYWLAPAFSEDVWSKGRNDRDEEAPS